MDRYAIYNVVGDVATRNKRASAPVHRRYVERLFKDQRRVTRGRSIVVRDIEVIDNIDEIRRKTELGFIKLRTLDGRDVNLDTLEPYEPIKSVPMPKPLDDSIAKDKPRGIPAPQFPGGKTLDQLVVEAQETSVSHDASSSTDDEEVDFYEQPKHKQSGKRRNRQGPNAS